MSDDPTANDRRETKDRRKTKNKPKATGKSADPSESTANSAAATPSATSSAAPAATPAATLSSSGPSFHAPAEPDWHRRISEAAYYLAVKRNFADGDPLQDWLAAEEAVSKALKD